MIYMIESVEIAPTDLSRYLQAFEELFLPPARVRGADLVACWHTPDDLGENVTVTTIFRMRDWGHWEDIRNRTVVDPAMPPWNELRSQIVLGGTRRFYEEAAFSPPV